MNSLKFKRGFKDWDQTYEVKIVPEYTADLEKIITSVEFYDPAKGLKAQIPWNAIEPFLIGRTSVPYFDEKGLNVRVDGTSIIISNSRGLKIKVKEDQAKSIYLTANRMLDDITDAVRKLAGDYK